MRCEWVQEVKWLEVMQEPNLTNNPMLLPEIPSATNLQLKPDTNDVVKSIPDVVIPDVTRRRFQQLLDVKYNSIVSKSAADIGRPNLIEMDIPTDGPPVASKPYTVQLKYREFVEHEIKQLEEAGIISQGMSDWQSPILVLLKKEECTENSSDPSTTTSNNSNKYHHRQLTSEI